MGGVLKPGQCVSGDVPHNVTQVFCVPEYPQKPVVHLKRPTAINTKGKMTHCDVDFFAGQRNEARGNWGEGVRGLDLGTTVFEALGGGVSSFLLFRGF